VTLALHRTRRGLPRAASTYRCRRAPPKGWTAAPLWYGAGHWCRTAVVAPGHRARHRAAGG
jgi:hypothetical protein